MARLSSPIPMRLIAVVVFGLLASGCSTETPQPIRETSSAEVEVSASPTPSETVSPTTATPTSEVTQPPTTDGAYAVVTAGSVLPDGVNAEVSGFINGVSEDGGTCTFTLEASTGAESVVQIESVGLANVDTTACGWVTVPTSDLHRGTWTVVLTYESDVTSATSEPVTLEVP